MLADSDVSSLFCPDDKLHLWRVFLKMGGCSAPNCSNSTTIGKQLFRFPKDPVRMRKWLVNCRRDFEPTPCSRLCQDHFEESQFEEIARSPAGGRKLKPNAIPTLFNVPDPPSHVTPQIVFPLKNEPVEKDLNMGDHGYARRQPPLDSEEDGVQRAEEERPCSLCQHYKTKLEQQQQHTIRLQREAEEMKKRLYKLSKIEKGLQVFLYEDQIRALTLAKRSRRAVWSHDTLLTARKIRCTVGVKGYEYLRELGYPLPSYRTLCNRLEPKMMVTTSMQDELAELGLGIITACDSPEGNATSDEGLIGVMT
ncbi:52 kDa repressor of the inhibitor of the protein kinase [Myxocyprinus asiaticus]|uniref:52 kDa repressor of the inhibitor of the protein kinase n=1 Tax=Myxocyprinus asiaticus TaxID=70543 RepID=UPI002221865E|nr:52 kDa repressor of the inhibitor of the protein kinase [Myxocyprinus asiaticus]